MGQYGKPKAYLYWYKSSQDAKTEYIYIIAFTAKQAYFTFCQKGYNRMYDYASEYIDEIHADDWLTTHEIGDILGQTAII